MPVMTVEEHINVIDEQELLNRLKLFLQSQGWTIVRHEENKAWVNIPPYGFAAGDEFFLEVTSNGYGNQNLHFRFRVFGSATNRRNFVGNQGYGNTELDTTSSNHPAIYFKNPVSTFYELRPFTTATFIDGMSSFISDAVMPRVWFIGFEQKYCCVVIQLDSQRVHYFHFGTHEMHDFNADYGAFCYARDNADWKTSIIDTPFDPLGGFESFDEYVTHAGRNGNTANKQSFSLPSGANGAHSEYCQAWAFNAHPLSFPVVNTFSELRPFSRAYQYVIDPGDGIWFYSARAFWYRISTVNFRIGERFDVSAEKYIAFPSFKVDESKIGVAFRVL